MKKILMTISFLSAFMAFGEYSAKFINAMRKGADTSVEIRISDDDGSPVSNATVHVCYNVGKGRSEVFGKTDESGVFLFDRKTNGYGEIYVTKDGFYNSASRFSFIDMGNEHEVANGAWQPSPSSMRILIRKIHKPIHLVSKYDWVDVPTTNRWISFDMMKQDWLPPYGKGITEDFRIFFLWNGKKPNERAEASLVLKVASDEPGAYICPRHPDSEFSSSYHASTNKFIDNEFRWNFHYENGRCVEQFMDTNVELILRTRCITNQITKAVSYNYGRIYKMPFSGGWQGKGGIGLFYDFNPTPNDTNLEPRR